jgi:hypothetical protein
MTVRFALAALAMIVLSAPSAYAASESAIRSCPKYLNQNAINHMLDGVKVYNGSPDDQDELFPDENGWNLEDYAYSGHELYLVCRYKDTSSVERYIIPKTSKSCKPEGKNILCR